MQREKRKASKGVAELLAEPSDDYEDVQPAPKMPKKGDKVEKVRVWWPPTRDKERTGFSGAYWPASVLKKGSNFLTVEYDNGESEKVDPDNIFPYDVPIEFGKETVPLAVGEFVEVSNNSKTDPCAWVGKIATIGKKCLIDYPFHDSPSEYIKLELLRRARVWDDLDWKYIELGQKWKAGEVTSPIELNLVSEEEYYRALKQAGSSSGKSSKSKRAAADAASDDAESEDEGSSQEEEPQPSKQRGRPRKSQHPSRAVLDDNNGTEHKDEKPKGAKKRKPAAVRQAPTQEDSGKQCQQSQQQRQQAKQMKLVALRSLTAPAVDDAAASKATATAAAEDWKAKVLAAKMKKAEAAKAATDKNGQTDLVNSKVALAAGSPKSVAAATTKVVHTLKAVAAATTAKASYRPTTAAAAATAKAATRAAVAAEKVVSSSKAASNLEATTAAVAVHVHGLDHPVGLPQAIPHTPKPTVAAKDQRAALNHAADSNTGSAAPSSHAAPSAATKAGADAGKQAAAVPAAAAAPELNKAGNSSQAATGGAEACLGTAAAPCTLSELLQGLDQPVVLLPAGVGAANQSPMMLLLPKATTPAVATAALGRLAAGRAATAAGLLGAAGESGLKALGSGTAGVREASGRSIAVPPVPAFAGAPAAGSGDEAAATAASMQLPPAAQLLGLPPGTSAVAVAAELEARLSQLNLTDARFALQELYTNEAYLLLVDCWRADSPKLADALRSFKANIKGVTKPDYQAFMVGIFGMEKMQSLELAKK